VRINCYDRELKSKSVFSQAKWFVDRMETISHYHRSSLQGVLWRSFGEPRRLCSHLSSVDRARQETSQTVRVNYCRCFKSLHSLIVQLAIVFSFLTDQSHHLSSKERSDGSLSTDVDVDSLDLGVVLDGVFTEFSTDTRLLETTERNLRVKLVVTVDPDGTALESLSDSVCSRSVLGKDGGSKTVDRVVGGVNDLLLGVELGHDDNGTKDLFLDNLHVGSDVSENCLSVSWLPACARKSLLAR
jgi:hypothetical protein